MAKTIEVALWDDLELARGRRVRADCTVRIGWGRPGHGGGWVIKELELTDENAAELDAVLASYLKAGHAPDSPSRRASLAGSQNSKERRDYRRALRAWAEKEGIRSPRDPSRFAFVSKSGGWTYPSWLEARYEQYLLEQAGAG